MGYIESEKGPKRNPGLNTTIYIYMFFLCSDDDVGGKDRRRNRRAAKQKAFKVGKRNPDSDGSEYSYKSVRSAGGTRRVTRRRKKEDGTYSDEQSYHSSQVHIIQFASKIFGAPRQAKINLSIEVGGA